MSEKLFGEWSVEFATDFIEKWESFAAVPYLCPAGVLTIGFGHTAVVQKGDGPLTYHEAEELLVEDLEAIRDRFAEHVEVRLSENRFIALMSLAFNLGADGVVRKCPRLMSALNRGDWSACADEFGDVVRAGGKVLPGLVRRRAAEAELMRRG